MKEHSGRLKTIMIFVVFVVVIISGFVIFKSQSAAKGDPIVSEACQRAKENPTNEYQGITLDQAVCIGSVDPSVQ